MKPDATLRYYEAILGYEWERMGEAIDWLQPRADSRLEVVFGIALLERFCRIYQGDEMNHLVHFEADHIRLSEPFGSVMGWHSGDSSAVLTMQHEVKGRPWDFAIWTAGDNGARREEHTLSELIDVDGFQAHRRQRNHDMRKTTPKGVRGIRVLEEQFVDVSQAATAALFATVWGCMDCYDNGTSSCGVCHRDRLVFHENPLAQPPPTA